MFNLSIILFHTQMGNVSYEQRYIKIMFTSQKTTGLVLVILLIFAIHRFRNTVSLSKISFNTWFLEINHLFSLSLCHQNYRLMIYFLTKCAISYHQITFSISGGCYLSLSQKQDFTKINKFSFTNKCSHNLEKDINLLISELIIHFLKTLSFQASARELL